MPGASFSNKKKLGKLRQLRVVCQVAAANDGSDAGRGRLKVQVEIEFVIELSTHTHTQRQSGRLVLARLVSCAPESVLCFLLAQRKRRSALAYVSSMLRRQAAATGSSNKLLLSMLAETLSRALSLSFSICRSLAALATCQQQLLRGLSKQCFDNM